LSALADSPQHTTSPDVATQMLADLTVRVARRSGCCALIAIKDRARCKTRLCEALDERVRRDLVQSMLMHVLDAARNAQTVQQVIVVSPERDDVPIDVPVLTDAGVGLNDACAIAHQAVQAMNYRELLILPADLPLLTSAEIDRLVRAGRRSGFAIAPDSADRGTNALCLDAASPFNFQFGSDSKRLHLLEASRQRLGAQVLRLSGFAFDTDTPEDVRALGQMGWRACQHA
jgi:2-phospho-L-lactate guanylyltransferase